MKSEISFQDFEKLEIKVGTIVSAEKIPNSDKLLKLVIDFGSEQRQVLAGIAEHYSPEQLVGLQVPVLMNIAPRKMRGLDSNGMILAADEAGKPVLMHPEKKMLNGSEIK